MTACNPAHARARRGAGRALAALALALPAACVAPRPPANPFVGGWNTAELQRIAFRDDTVVIAPPGERPTPLSAASCDGNFRFAYRRENRGELIGLASHQPDLQRQLADLLPRPDYAVAEVACGEGGTVYVLLGDRDILAIHRDRDIAGIERLSRS